jgi:glucokinase
MPVTHIPEYAIGVDIGGTTTKFGLVNRRGDISYHASIPTTKYEKVEDFVNDLHEALSYAVEENGGTENMKGIGVGAPNGNFYKGTIEYAPNLKWKGVIPMAAMISEKFQLPCALTNDANAAAVGEMMYGAARGMKDFIVITLGTGVGSGIVANGQVIYGHDGFAGELGHTIIRPGGREHWGTKMKGSLEAYASATGIRLTALEFMKNRPKEKTLLRQYKDEEIDARIIYECAIQGDKMAKEVYEFSGQILGESLANFIMFSSPEAIILFGGVTKAEDLILKPTKMHMEKNLLPIFQNKIKLLLSELKEADAAILGASALVWEMK